MWVWHWRLLSGFAETAEFTVSRVVEVNDALRVPMVEVKLPTEVRYFPGRSHHIDVIPPAWWSATYPLAILHVAKQVRQLQAGVGPWVISANKDGVRTIFLVPDVAKHFRCTREEVAFQF